MSDLWTRSATGLAAGIARGEISSVEAVSAHIARIEEVDGMLNAVVVRRFEEALAEARAADQARARGATLAEMHGLPVTLKETLDLAGTPSTFGLTTRSHDRAPQDDPYVARWRAAGAIVVAKTNVSQLTIFAEADNPVYGRTNNPWDIERSCGGSSGGEGAIVAAGGSPLGLGTDIGGSLRSPATVNGIASLKPTAGRLDDRTRLTAFAGQTAIVSQVGPLARTVADLELGLRVANGGEFGSDTTEGVRGLRVGFYDNLEMFAAAPALARATREAAALLGELGATVVPFAPPSVEHAMDLFYGILAADGARGARAELGTGPLDPRVAELVAIVSEPRPVIVAIECLLRLIRQPGFANIVANYGFHDTRHYWDLCAALEQYRIRFSAAMDAAKGGALDLIVCPPNGLPALRHGASAHVVTSGPYAPLYNALGYPCGTLPFTRVRAGEEIGRKSSRDRIERAALATERGSAGLPAGVQLVARPWREDVLFRAMYALEDAARARADFPSTPVTPSYGPASQK
jgi:fatty acid amide hydrolase